MKHEWEYKAQTDREQSKENARDRDKNCMRGRESVQNGHEREAKKIQERRLNDVLGEEQQKVGVYVRG